MMSEDKITEKWERACRRFYETKGYYPDEVREEMWFLCLTLESILGLPKGASADKVREIADEESRTAERRPKGLSLTR